MLGRMPLWGCLKKLLDEPTQWWQFMEKTNSRLYNDSSGDSYEIYQKLAYLYHLGAYKFGCVGAVCANVAGEDSERFSHWKWTGCGRAHGG
jgi:hypothetical protein